MSGPSGLDKYWINNQPTRTAFYCETQFIGKPAVYNTVIMLIITIMI